MPKTVWPRQAGPRKVWPLSPQDVADRRREAEAESKKRVLEAALAGAASIPPFVL